MSTENSRRRGRSAYSDVSRIAGDRAWARGCGTAVADLEAIAAAATFHPDVVLMEIRLAGGSSGIEAAREIHASHGLRCIFLSGNLDETTRRTLQPYEPMGFIAKPILPSALQSALEMPEGCHHCSIPRSHGTVIGPRVCRVGRRILGESDIPSALRAVRLGACVPAVLQRVGWH
jgi:CheY-like chemotaxis protein